MYCNTKLFSKHVLILCTEIWQMPLHMAGCSGWLLVCAVSPETHLFNWLFVEVVLWCRGVVFGQVNPLNTNG